MTDTLRPYRPTFLLVGEVEYPACALGTEVGGGGGGLSAPRSPDWDSAASSTIRSDLLHTTMGGGRALSSRIQKIIQVD